MTLEFEMNFLNHPSEQYYQTLQTVDGPLLKPSFPQK